MSATPTPTSLDVIISVKRSLANPGSVEMSKSAMPDKSCVVWTKGVRLSHSNSGSSLYVRLLGDTSDWFFMPEQLREYGALCANKSCETVTA